MATITLKGNPIRTSGELPAVGAPLPAFTLLSDALAVHTRESLAGHVLVLTLNPSVDTGVCATTLRQFNARAAGLADTRVLAVSADLPFALKRFCGAEGITNVLALSTLRDPGFADRFGVRITEGTLENLTARAILVADRAGTVVHAELVPEIASEPNYDAALAAAKQASERTDHGA